MEAVKGVEQPMVCRNVAFLLLFVFHLLLLVSAVSRVFGPIVVDEWRGDSTSSSSSSAAGVLYTTHLVFLAAIAGVCSILGSHLILWTATARPLFFPVTLWCAIAAAFFWGTAGVGIRPHTAVPVTGFLALALAVGCAFIVWDRIPFAAANVAMAVAGIPWAWVGMVVCIQLVAWIATVYYGVDLCGVVLWSQSAWEPEMVPWVYGALLCSVVWTLQVPQGVVQTTTGSWWHNPQHHSIVKESFLKTVFYSLGSICFGAIVVTPVRVLRLVSVLFRGPSSEESSSLLVLHEIVYCVQSCLFSCVDAIAARVNPWAYTYIGMYHYNFLDAGYGATELFAMRGWSTIVSDDLVPNVFFLTSLLISGITGCCTYAVARWEDIRITPGETEDQAPGLLTFVVGAVIGWVMSSIVLSVVSSGVNAVLVCFAPSPPSSPW